MSDTDALRDFYRTHPEMVSSPFGGVSGYRTDELEAVWKKIGYPGRDRGSGAALLEVGCGRGWLRRYFEELGWEYTGLDLVAPEAVEGARGPDLLGDSGRLPFADESFDSLVCIEAYEHFPDVERSVGEFYRVLRPGGDLFLSTPNYANTAGLVKKWMETTGKYEKDTWAPFGRWTPQAHEHFVTLNAVRKIYGQAGFHSGKVCGYADDVYLAVFPWAAHPKCPERILFRLQEWFPGVKQKLADRFPTFSLHQFWRWVK